MPSKHATNASQIRHWCLVGEFARGSQAQILAIHRPDHAEEPSEVVGLHDGMALGEQVNGGGRNAPLGSEAEMSIRRQLPEGVPEEL